MCIYAQRGRKKKREQDISLMKQTLHPNKPKRLAVDLTKKKKKEEENSANYNLTNEMQENYLSMMFFSFVSSYLHHSKS